MGYSRLPLDFRRPQQEPPAPLVRHESLWESSEGKKVLSTPDQRYWRSQGVRFSLLQNKGKDAACGVSCCGRRRGTPRLYGWFLYDCDFTVKRLRTIPSAVTTGIFGRRS